MICDVCKQPKVCYRGGNFDRVCWPCILDFYPQAAFAGGLRNAPAEFTVGTGDTAVLFRQLCGPTAENQHYVKTMTGSLKRRFLQAPILPEPGDKSPVDYSIDLARHHRQLTLWNYNRLLILTVVNIVCAVVYLVVAATGGLR